MGHKIWGSSVPHLKEQVKQSASTVWSCAGTINVSSLPIRTECEVKFFKQVFTLDKIRTGIQDKYSWEIQRYLATHTLIGMKTAHLMRIICHFSLKYGRFNFIKQSQTDLTAVLHSPCRQYSDNGFKIFYMLWLLIEKPIWMLEILSSVWISICWQHGDN
jgi:hypothetical protein